MTTTSIKTDSDRNYPTLWAYISYSEAKANGIKKGDVVDGMKVVEYITWRTDTNREFAGFKLEINQNAEIDFDHEAYLEGLDESLTDENLSHVYKCSICGSWEMVQECPSGCRGSEMKLAIYNREANKSEFVS